MASNMVTKEYKDFRGVDFNLGEISTKRSPFSLNMWKNYKENAKCIETRPDIELKDTFDNKIYSMTIFKNHKIVHSGTKLYDNGKEIFTGMNLEKSQYFIYDEKLYIKDGLNYLKYNGTEVKQVKGYIPITSIGKSPKGQGTTFQDVNLLNGERKNSFVGDGTTLDYQLDTQNLDGDYVVTASVNGKAMIEGVDLSVNITTGVVTFRIAPPKPITSGQDNVIITFSKTMPGYRDRILRCNLLTEFDNRIFFSGNPNFPNVIFHSSLENPEYISDLDYYEEGDNAKVKAMVAGNNALWVIKEPSQANTSIFYHNPVIDSKYGKIYPSVHSSISTGCVSTGINFNDDIVFFSNRGLEGISSNITTEQVLSHRSSMVDSKLLQEANYKGLMVEEWNGYLLVVVDNKIYLADSRAKYQNLNSFQYEWFYWEFDKPISMTYVKDDILYLGMNNEIHTLTNNNTNIKSVWQIGKDDFGYPQLQKITNKRGGTSICNGEITLKIKADDKPFRTIGTYKSNDYIVYRIKEKKFKELLLEFSSNKPMKLYNATIECFIGGYIKH